MGVVFRHFEDAGADKHAEDSVAKPEASVAAENSSTKNIVPVNFCKKRRVQPCERNMMCAKKCMQPLKALGIDALIDTHCSHAALNLHVFGGVKAGKGLPHIPAKSCTSPPKSSANE